MQTQSNAALAHTARQILSAGITAKSHHETIKKAFRANGWTDLTIVEMRAALEQAAQVVESEARAETEANPVVKRGRARNAEKVVEVLENTVAAAAKRTKGEPKQVRRVTLKEVQAVGGKWSKVVAIAAHGKKGQPSRVIIRCQAEGCSNTREIATQDLFQVNTCSAACKKAHAKQG